MARFMSRSSGINSTDDVIAAPSSPIDTGRLSRTLPALALHDAGPGFEQTFSVAGHL